MTQTSLVCGTESLKDKAYFTETVGKIVATREWTKKALEELGFVSTDSKANFLFVTHPSYDAKELFEALKANDIYVRYWSSARISQHLRITIGTQEEMESLIEFLKKYMCKE
jgi:histidinol-phosphate aminotransferase